MEVAENHHTDRNRPWRRLRVFAPAALLLLISAGFYWKIVLTGQFTWLDSPDLSNQVLPWLQVQAGEWHQGRLPLWDPYLWGGQSLIGQTQPGVAYPLNWILFLLPLRHGWIRQSYLNWYFVLIHFMASWFGYLLCRDLKRSRLASIVAGCVFAFGGWVGVTEWPQMLNSAVWAPLVLLFLLRSLRGERPVASAAASGAFFGMAWLGGHHQIPIFLLLTTGAIWTYHVFRRGLPDWRVVRLAAVFLVFMVLVSGLQTLPAYEYGKLAKRWVGAEEPKGWTEPVPYTVHSRYSLIPTSLLGIVVPGVNRYGDPFIGVTALSLALLAAAMAWRESAVKMFAAVAAGGLLFSLGRNNVFHGVIYALVPLVEKARTPSNAVCIYHFGIAVLTAYGIDYLLSANESPWPRRAAISLAVFGGLVFALLGALVLGQKPPGDDRFAVIALVALLLAWLLQAWRRGHITPRAGVVLALGLMLIEFANLSGIYWPNREEKDRNAFVKPLAGDSDLAGFLLSLPWPVRVEVSNQDIPYNFGDWYGIDQYGGYVASLPAALLDLPWQDPRTRQLFGVNYTVARAPPGPNQQEVFQTARGLKVYRNADALPRVWTVHEAQQVRDKGEARAILQDRTFDLRRRTFLLEPPPPEMESCQEADDVRLVRRNSGRVTIEADMGCRGMVILGDSYFPGWVARVDGRRTKIYEAYAAVRGVMAGKGRHTIEMRYLPVSVIAGLIMSLSGALGAVVVSFRARAEGGMRA
jgi:hypothetical protein